MRQITLDDLNAHRVRFSEHGDAPPIMPVVAQDVATGSVLMVAWADHEALEKSLQTGQMHYYSRSRGALWRKGEQSGNTQRLVALWTDCDQDTALAVVEQQGPACHTDAPTCFHNDPNEAPRAGGILGALSALVRERDATRPEGSHTTRLLEDENLRLKKLVEEAGELQVELARGDKDRAREEAADLLYHMLVALHATGTSIEDVLKQLQKRRG